MNIIERSNEMSILQTLLRPLSVNPFIYSYNFNMSDGVKYSEFIYPRFQTVIGYGDVIYFDIPKYGLLSKLILETTLTTTEDNRVAQDKPGERIFEWLDLQTVGGARSIQKTTSQYISLKTDQLDPSTNSRMSLLLNPYPDFNNTTSIVYTPFYGFFSEHPNKFINTKETEDLQLVCKIADSYTYMGFPNALSSNPVVRLHATYFTTTTPIPRSPQMMTLNEFGEPYQLLLTGATSASQFITCNRSVHSTHFILLNNDQERFNINNITFKVDGKKFYDTENRLALIDQGWYSNTGLEVDNSRPSNALGNRFFSIYWGLYPDKNHNTLCIDFANMGAVEVNLTFDALDDEYLLFIIHDFWDVLNFTEEGEIYRNYIH